MAKDYLDFKSIALLEKNQDKMFQQLSGLTSSTDLYFLLDKEERKKFFTKYYYTKEDIDILIKVIFTHSVEAENSKNFKELFFLYFYLILIIKYSIEYKLINSKTLEYINVDILLKKVNELAKYFSQNEKLKSTIEFFQTKIDFLTLNNKDTILIKNTTDSIEFIFKKEDDI